MPKKRKKTKSKRKTSKKRRVKKRKKISKQKKIKSNNKKIQDNKEGSTQELIFKTKPEWVKSGLINKSQYQNKYKDSIKNNNAFWKKEGKRISWIKPYKKIKDVK